MATPERRVVSTTTSALVRLADAMRIARTMLALSGAIVPKDMLVTQ